MAREAIEKMNDQPEFEVAEDRRSPGDWRVEDIDYVHEGECHAAIFMGKDAESRAREYAAWMNTGRTDSLASAGQ